MHLHLMSVTRPIAMAIFVVLLAPSFAIPDPVPPAVKPSRPLNTEAAGTDLPSPQSAFDSSTSSGSGLTATQDCKWDGLTPIERTTTW